MVVPDTIQAKLVGKIIILKFGLAAEIGIKFENYQILRKFVRKNFESILLKIVILKFGLASETLKTIKFCDICPKKKLSNFAKLV